jgi:putative transposase
MDFVHYKLATGRELRGRTLIDTFSRFSRAVESRFTFQAPDVAGILKESGETWDSQQRSRRTGH